MTITLAQLKALQEYMEMYGVDRMDFNKDLFEETLENFAPVNAPVNYPKPVGTSTFWLTTKEEMKLKLLHFHST